MFVPIDKIKFNPSNPRIIKDEKFKKLKKSIQEFPDMLNKRPLVCYTDKDGKFIVLGGNMTIKNLNPGNKLYSKNYDEIETVDDHVKFWDWVRSKSKTNKVNSLRIQRLLGEAIKINRMRSFLDLKVNLFE